MLVEQELIWHLNRKDGVFSFWLSALVENNEAIALLLAGAALKYEWLSSTSDCWTLSLPQQSAYTLLDSH